jgi:hypothetical protein
VSSADVAVGVGWLDIVLVTTTAEKCLPAFAFCSALDS